MTQNTIKPSEISDILLGQLKDIDTTVHFEETDPGAAVQPSVCVVHRGEGGDQVAGLPEVLGIAVVRVGHLEEAVRQPPVEGTFRCRDLQFVEGLLGDGEVSVDLLVGYDVLHSR